MQKVTENAFAVSGCKWLYHAKFRNLQKDTKSVERLSIPVRVTTLLTPGWLYRAVLELFILRKNWFVQCVSNVVEPLSNGCFHE